jgi:hypothetical protein
MAKKKTTKSKAEMKDRTWRIPSDIGHAFPDLIPLLQKMHIPEFDCEDQLMWSPSKSGLLSFKDAYFHFSPTGQQIPWAKTIWNQHFPPSKSFVLWKWLWNVLPTDDVLMTRGCNIASRCDLCGTNFEASHHIFIHCRFARKIWQWFSHILQMQVADNIEDIMRLCNRGWSKPCGEVVTAGIIHIVDTIWYCRNQVRFHGKQVKFQTAINCICANVYITGTFTKSPALESMQEFQLLKAFSIKVIPHNAPRIKEVYWYPPRAF